MPIELNLLSIRFIFKNNFATSFVQQSTQVCRFGDKTLQPVKWILELIKAGNRHSPYGLLFHSLNKHFLRT